MIDLPKTWKGLVARAVNELLAESGGDAGPLKTDEIVAEQPPRPELGDLAFPMFPFAKRLKLAPVLVAGRIKDRLANGAVPLPGEVSAAGPYLNVRFAIAEAAESIIDEVLARGQDYGRSRRLGGQRIVVEFSSPNTNKPLHLGHLRNDILGESVSRILKANGAEVFKVNLINDRGVHICKSMLAYERFGDGKTPETAGVKSDHFVGDYYVRFNSWAKEEPQAEEGARELLRRWEAGDGAVRKLWATMNRWAIDGISETYRRTGIAFDRVYYESDTYERGREEVLKGLEAGVFYREEDGSVWIDLTDAGLDKKVLLRKDGTTVYVTQDIGTAIARHRDYPFDRLIYVVASEQQYHFKVLFQVLGRLGFPWATNLFHLSYGMVNLPEGKMKSREGTVVDADDLLDDLARMAADEIRQKGREEEVGDVAATAEAIALGALNYYLLQVSPPKDMIFDPKESISFTGNTGPYLQYMGTRIQSMLRKVDGGTPAAEDAGIAAGDRGDEPLGRFRPELLQRGDEWEVVKLLGVYPEMVERSAAEYNPSLLAGFLYDLSSTFSRYYHDTPILHNADADLVATRVRLCRAVAQVLRNAFDLVAIPYLDRM